MTPEQIEKERAAFEAWMDELYPTNPQTGRVGDEYSRLGTQYKWEGWQARAEQSAWISVEDKLPELNKEVLTDYTSADYPPPNANACKASLTTTRKSRGAANPPPNAQTARDTKP